MRTIIFIIFIFNSITSFGQGEMNVYARLHSVEINGDVYAPDKVETIVFSVEEISDIVEFGNIDGIRFGLRVEIHESQINPELSYIVRRNMYFRRPFETEWKVINTSLNTYNILSSEKLIDFSEQDRLGQHNSVEETRTIANEDLKFKIIYDCVYQWK